jgi:hypothetical protein
MEVLKWAMHGYYQALSNRSSNGLVCKAHNMHLRRENATRANPVLTGLHSATHSVGIESEASGKLGRQQYSRLQLIPRVLSSQILEINTANT